MAGRTHVVIAGGGVAALEAALALRELAAGLVSVEVVAPVTEFVYAPLAVAEPFHLGEVRRYPLPRLVEEAGAAFTQARVTGVDTDREVALLDDGREAAYDALLLALGARAHEAIAGTLTFRGPQDSPALAQLLDDAVSGRVRRIVFAVPGGATWPLPLYELALLTRVELADRGATGVEVSVVTPEERPLGVFGGAVADTVAELLQIRGIDVRTHTTPLAQHNGALRCAPGFEVPADRVVALPRLEGPALAGVAHDAHGFIPVDEYARVAHEADVYAAGDITSFPVKQGGIAAQQADVAAAAIAETAGAPVTPEPFRPVLRGLLLTGMVPRYLRADATGESVADTEPLWWPPAKIVGHHLAPFLARGLVHSA